LGDLPWEPQHDKISQPLPSQRGITDVSCPRFTQARNFGGRYEITNNQRSHVTPEEKLKEPSGVVALDKVQKFPRRSVTTAVSISMRTQSATSC
jgi:hypothetical protein